MKYLFAVLLLSGCASMPGVVADKDELAACKARGCSVWTMDELTKLARKFYGEGYKDGKKSI
jgi:uncharacterized protein YceK